MCGSVCVCVYVCLYVCVCTKVRGGRRQCADEAAAQRCGSGAPTLVRRCVSPTLKRSAT